MREQELEILKTACFLEEQLARQAEEAQRLQKEMPVRPVQPQAPREEKQTAVRIPYPEIDPDVTLPKLHLWKFPLAAMLAGVLVFAAGLLAAGKAVRIALMIAGAALFAFGGIRMILAYLNRDRKYAETLAALKAKRAEEIKKSSEYLRQCGEIDEQNRKNQSRLNGTLHEEYLRREEVYREERQVYERELAVFENTYPGWAEEKQALDAVLCQIRAALDEIYERIALPAEYRNRAAVRYLASFMGTSDFDLRYAMERYNTSVMLMAQRKDIGILEAQVIVTNAALRNQEYANWLNKQLCDQAEHGNGILNGSDHWKKAEIAVCEYEKIKVHRAAKAVG